MTLTRVSPRFTLKIPAQYRALQDSGTLKLHQLWFLKHRDAAAEEERVKKAVLEATNALEARLAELRHVELPPFAAAVKAGVASVMTAHVVFAAFDLAAGAKTHGRTLESWLDSVLEVGVVGGEEDGVVGEM